MKVKIILLVTLLSLFSSSFALCPSSGNMFPPCYIEKMYKQSDKSVLSWLITLNKNQIAAAKMAMKAKASPVVTQYAAIVNKDHSKNLDSALKLAKKLQQGSSKSEQVKSLENQGKNELSQLRSLNNRRFQVAYINSEVKIQEEAVKKIDENLKNTSDPSLKKNLQSTRTTCMNHLRRAKIIQNRFGN